MKPTDERRFCVDCANHRRDGRADRCVLMAHVVTAELVSCLAMRFLAHTDPQLEKHVPITDKLPPCGLSGRHFEPKSPAQILRELRLGQIF